MSRAASLAIISVTITVTACLAIAMFFMNPNAGEDSYGARVLEEAKARQTQSIVSVPEPLQTDVVVLSEEQKMAEKVSLILLADEEFVDGISAQAAPAVGEKITDLEETYSSDMVGRIAASNEDAKAYVDQETEALTAYVDQETEALTAYVDQETEALRTYVDEKTASSAEVVAVESLTEEEILNIVLGSEKFSATLEKAMEEYHENHPQTVVTTVESAPRSRDHIAIPEFPVKEASEYSDEEYAEERSNARLNEIDRVLEFLGY